MEAASKEVARRAAKIIEESGHAGLRLQVEEAIGAQSAGQLNDTIALASLVVSAAGFAWKVAWDLYTESRKRKEEKEKDRNADAELRAAIETAIAEELESVGIVDETTRVLVVKATTDATLARLAASR